MTPDASDEPAVTELLYDDLEVGSEFPPLRYEVTADLVTAYSIAIGDHNRLYRDADEAGPLGLSVPVAPPGLSGIWGRLSYLTERTMPAGGILVGQDFLFHQPVPVGTTLLVRATVAARWQKEEKKFVTIESNAADQSGTVYGTVRVTAIWPR